MSPARILALTRKEIREIVRDPIFALLAFFLPVMLLLVFIYGMGRDVENVPFAVLDEDHSAASRDYAHRFIASRYFRLHARLGSMHDAEPLLADGAVRVVIVIPERFGQRLGAGRAASVQFLVDGTFIAPARTILGYIQAIHADAVAGLQRDFLIRRMGLQPERAAVLLQPVGTEVRYLYNAELHNVWAAGPSEVMLILMIVVPLLTALSVVREKESGAIYNVYSSTISRGELVAGKMLPNVAISAFDALVLVVMVRWWFGVPFRGSILVLLVATALFIGCLAAFGLLVSLLVRTQAGAMIVAIVLSMIVGLQFSGMITPVASLTGVNALLTRLLPAMYYHNVVQGCFLKGTGASGLMQDVGVLAAYCVGLVGLCYRQFHKRVPQ
jgi:drug efflux transport system permease protein